MTPRMYGLLLKRHEWQRKVEDRRAGEVVAMLYNLNRDDTKDPVGWDWTDVFPEWGEPVRLQSEDEMFNAMQAWVGPAKELSN